VCLRTVVHGTAGSLDESLEFICLYAYSPKLIKNVE